MGTQLLTKLLSTHIGLDLGTANCLVFVRDLGVVINEPSVVAMKVNTHEVFAVGREAKEMLGKTPLNITAVRPMKDGVIANYEVTESMLRYFIQRAMKAVPLRQRLLRPRVLIAVPSGITEVERRAVVDSAKQAGAGDVVDMIVGTEINENTFFPRCANGDNRESISFICREGKNDVSALVPTDCRCLLIYVRKTGKGVQITTPVLDELSRNFNRECSFSCSNPFWNR